jgi:cell division protein FtsL
MHRSTAIFFLLALVGGFILFKVKYEVVEIEQKLAQTERQIAREKETIHILKAEWSHLNEPQRLQKLAEKYLDIVPMKTEQIAAVVSDFNNEANFKNFFPQPHFTSMKRAE